MFARTFVALLAVSAFAASASAAAITARDPVCSCVPDINGDEGVLMITHFKIIKWRSKYTHVAVNTLT